MYVNSKIDNNNHIYNFVSAKLKHEFQQIKQICAIFHRIEHKYPTKWYRISKVVKDLEECYAH